MRLISALLVLSLAASVPILMFGKTDNACRAVGSLTLEHGRITSVSASSGAHAFSMLALYAGIPWIKLPASCRVRVTLNPSADSEIKSEVWMPAEHWNGRFWEVGNGGFAGAIDSLSLAVALRHGYATAGTDTGHEGSDRDGRWAFHHPEKLIDYGNRAIHGTAVAAKAIISAYYHRPARYSYFVSGSNGGREALMEAQRYPEDFDGIEAGAPAYDGAKNIATASWIQQQLLDVRDAWISPDKLPAIASAVMRQCDVLDGVKDGLIEDPRLCHPDLQVLLCHGEENRRCLSPAQLRALRAIYEGPPDSHAGYAPGGERGWHEWILGKKPRTSMLYAYALDFYRYLVLDDPNWDLEQFDYARDAKRIMDKLSPMYEARDPDLTRFEARGGKLIVYHGWSDMALAPLLTIDYFDAVRRVMGEERTNRFLRLYMVPGLEHVIAGPGPDVFGQGLAPPPGADPKTNVSRALEVWVEQAIAPEALIAAKYKNDLKPLIEPTTLKPLRTRPLCPYPQVAHYVGSGSIDEAKNFECRVGAVGAAP